MTRHRTGPDGQTHNSPGIQGHATIRFSANASLVDPALTAMDLPAHQLSMTVLMTPDTANFSGNVHGGHLLKLLDQVAFACTSRITLALSSVSAVRAASSSSGLKSTAGGSHVAPLVSP